MVRMVDGHTLTPATTARAVLNVLNLTTVFGLLIAVIGRSRLRKGGSGLIIAEHYRLALPRRGAFTIGNVILVPRGTMTRLVQHHPDVLAHEAAHAWQYAACLGLPFLPLYAVASAWSWLRTGDPASANFFERSAGLARGGYIERPTTNAGLRRLLGRPGS